MVAAAGVAATDVIQGRRIEAAQAVLATPSHAGSDRLLAQWESWEADDTARLTDITPPEALALAALWIDQAATSPLPRKQQALVRAEELLARARSVRPDAAAASVLAVRADLVRFGNPRVSTLEIFARSYRQAGFLREQGLWRLAFTAVYWPQLSDATRQAAVNEALWLAQLDGQLRLTVDQLVTGTPLALPVELRLASRVPG